MAQDPLSRCLDQDKKLTRSELEIVVQKKKITEVHSWFKEHFDICTKEEYMTRCPIVIIQGPTGCGKTSTIRWIANELNVPIKEYNELTDTTAINLGLSKHLNDVDGVERRRAMRFEHFVVNNIIYNPLYQDNSSQADSEFDSDDDFDMNYNSYVQRPPPPKSGVIIHVENPLGFGKTQRLLTQTLQRLVNIVRDLAKTNLRRVAIVFESLEGECETVVLSNRVKQSMNIKTIKFNPIIKTNMKKLVESLMRHYKHIAIDKDVLEQLISDCDGDIRACLNTLQLICNKSSIRKHMNGNYRANGEHTALHMLSPKQLIRDIKRVKIDHNHDINKSVALNTYMMRDSRSVGLFRALGKIFYQKRLYPDLDALPTGHNRPRSIDRPFQTENSTEELADMIDVESTDLLSWLHQHYYKFCKDSRIEKAALFLENLTTVDTINMTSTLSSQFYESQSILDSIQTHTAIEATVYSLYEDQSRVSKRTQKRIQMDNKIYIVKPSVESSKQDAANNFYSFKKPNSMNVNRLRGDFRTVLDACVSSLAERYAIGRDSRSVLVDYVPYLSQIGQLVRKASPGSRMAYPNGNIDKDSKLSRIIEILDDMKVDMEPDFDARHERLLEFIDEVSDGRSADNALRDL